MALANKKEKCEGYPSIYKYEGKAGLTSYYARITGMGMDKGWYNMTKKHGCTSARSSYIKLHEIYNEVAKGNDPFHIKSTVLNVLFEKYNNKRNEPYKTTSSTQYNKWVKKKIGSYKLSKITLEDIDSIMQDIEEAGLKASTKQAVKDLLMPVFKHEYELRNLDRNILKLVDTGYNRNKSKQRLSSTRDELLEIVNTLYNTMNTRVFGGENTKAIFLLSLMTGRRIGELKQLKYTDIDFETKLVHVRAETTKTNKENNFIYKYPIPDEVLELLKDNEGKDELIFPSHKDTYIRQYKLMMQSLNLKVNYKISSHTNRKFFISLCTKFDTDFVNEVALSHTSNEIKSVYLTYNYDDIKELYQYYWNEITKKNA